MGRGVSILYSNIKKEFPEIRTESETVGEQKTQRLCSNTRLVGTGILKILLYS